jgi:hypothetical protein
VSYIFARRLQDKKKSLKIKKEIKGTEKRNKGDRQLFLKKVAGPLFFVRIRTPGVV